MKLELGKADKAFEALGWLFLIALWGLTIASYAGLPDIIPMHFNGVGKVDGYGGRASILILPSIATILFVGMTLLNRFPHIFNYPVRITDENALRHYTNATRFLRVLKTVIIMILGLIESKTIQVAHGQADGLGIWFLPLALGFILFPLLIYIVKTSKDA